MKTCVMCAASATHYCPQDDAFLCSGCNTTIHSANLLASRHKVLAINEFLQQGGKAADAQSEASASPAALVKEETCMLSPPESLTGTEGVVPVMAANSTILEGTAPAAAVSTEQQQGGKWTSDFDLFDLDGGWLDKLDCGFDLGGMFDEAHLVPELMNDAPGVVPGSNAASLGEVPFFPSATTSTGAALDRFLPEVAESLSEQQHPAKRARLEAAASNEDMDLLVPNSFTVPSFDLPALDDTAFDTAPPATLFQSGSTPAAPAPAYQLPAPVVRVSAEQAAINRAERLSLYREKKKNRKFEKTIRYASRKAYAEVRPRIKGRFATPAEVAAMKAAAAAGKMAADEEDAVVPCM